MLPSSLLGASRFTTKIERALELNMHMLPRAADGMKRPFSSFETTIKSARIPPMHGFRPFAAFLAIPWTHAQHSACVRIDDIQKQHLNIGLLCCPGPSLRAPPERSSRNLVRCRSARSFSSRLVSVTAQVVCFHTVTLALSSLKKKAALITGVVYSPIQKSGREVCRRELPLPT